VHLNRKTGAPEPKKQCTSTEKLVHSDRTTSALQAKKTSNSLRKIATLAKERPSNGAAPYSQMYSDNFQQHQSVLLTFL
jgi:hypothetical protein